MRPTTRVDNMVPLITRLRNALRGLGVLADPGAWIDPSGHVLICAFPGSGPALRRLQRLGIRRLVNLHARRHPPHRLQAFAVTEIHVPVPDFGAPAPPDLAVALNAIHAAVVANEGVAVHCGGGLGRSGTVAACYLVDLGLDWQAAVARVRGVRPGAIETHAQLASVAAHAERRAALMRAGGARGAAPGLNDPRDCNDTRHP